MDKIIEEIKNKGDYITQVKLAKKCFPHLISFADFHDSPERHFITKAIHKYNDNPETEGIIISNSQGVKFANEKEARDFLKKQYIAVFKKLKYIRKIEKKVNKDGQYDIYNKLYEEFKNED